MKKPFNTHIVSILSLLCLVINVFQIEAQKKKNSSFKNVSYNTPANVVRSVSPAAINSAGNHYVVVSLTITRGALKGKAVLEDNMSLGLTATEIANSDSKFAYNKKKTVTFTWKKLPKEDEPIIVKYQVEASSSVSLPDKMTLTGKFVCGGRRVVIPPTDFTMNVIPVADTVKKILPPVAMNEVKTDTVKKTALVLHLTKSADTSHEVAYAAPIETHSAGDKKSPSEGNSTNSGLYYRIQIGAFTDQSKVHSLLTRCKITEKPYKEPAENSVIRYLIGKYSDIDAAKHQVAELKEKGLDGAYVVPYYRDKRITFQEASQIQSNSNTGNTKQQ